MRLFRTRTLGRRHVIAVIAAAAVLLIITGIGVYGLIAGPSTPAPNDIAEDEPAPVVTVPSGSAQPVETIPPVEPSTDPNAFARTVAERIFTWDTSTGFMPLDYTAAILTVADPNGTEQAGLASDLETYLPTREAWTDLRKYSTAQELKIDTAYVPGEWSEAVDQARPGQLPAGATAVTIEGTRHRTGVWNDEKVTSDHAVAFTVFLACPEDGTCSVLRLSALDQPLT